MNVKADSMRRALLPAALALLVGTAAATDDGKHGKQQQQGYENHVLVSNGAVAADFTDPNLLNGWGIAFNPTGFVWVSDQGSGKSTLYDGTGKPQALIVTIPGVGGEAGEPTGIVFSGGTDFVVSNGTTSGPARFIFATEGGTIAGWAPNVNATNALTAVDNSSSDAVYTGLALSGDGVTHLLYAANFSHARIDVFDGTFKPVQVPGGFTDRHLPKGYSPFGVHAINGDIYVTYAKQEEEGGEEEVQGPGLGVVNVFDTQGNLIRRVATAGVLNAPWGVALAPASFGKFGGALLVGNLGDGTINAYGPISGHFLGSLRDVNNRRIRAEGLWGMAFGNGINAQKTNALFYAAGPNDEVDGAYGVITAVTSN